MESDEEWPIEDADVEIDGGGDGGGGSGRKRAVDLHAAARARLKRQRWNLSVEKRSVSALRRGGELRADLEKLMGEANVAFALGNHHEALAKLNTVSGRDTHGQAGALRFLPHLATPHPPPSLHTHTGSWLPRCHRTVVPMRCSGSSTRIWTTPTR